MRIKSLLLALFFLACGGDADISGITSDPCSVDMECASGLCLTTLGIDSAHPIEFDGGYCSAVCYYEDFVSHGCGPEEICLNYDEDTYDNLPAEIAYCFTTGCKSDWDCRDSNYVCREFYVDVFLLGACIPIDAL